MDEEKRQRLEDAGWKVGDASEFLELTETDEAIIELRLTLARHLRDRRREQNVTQANLADRLNTSQPRVSKMENADEGASIESLVASLIELGADRREIGRIIAEG